MVLKTIQLIQLVVFRDACQETEEEGSPGGGAALTCFDWEMSHSCIGVVDCNLTEMQVAGG